MRGAGEQQPKHKRLNFRFVFFESFRYTTQITFTANFYDLLLSSRISTGVYKSDFDAADIPPCLLFESISPFGAADAAIRIRKWYFFFFHLMRARRLSFLTFFYNLIFYHPNEKSNNIKYTHSKRARSMSENEINSFPSLWAGEYINVRKSTAEFNTTERKKRASHFSATRNRARDAFNVPWL